MAKKFLPKALSVGLSLALCAGMVMPSFAAQVLNNTFIGSDGTLLGHDGNGNVATENARYDYELDRNLELEKTLVIKDGVDASIDLKGHDLVHTGAAGSVISIEGKLTLDDTTADTDEDGNYIAGSVTGGKRTDGKFFRGGGVSIEKDGSFELKNGKISGNQASASGGVVNNGGTFDMYGGEVSNNTTTAFDGGGVTIREQGTFNMYGGKITQNTAMGDAGGVCLVGQSTFNMYGGEISYNKVPGGQSINNNGGGIAIEMGTNNETGIDTSSNFNMYGGSIINNYAIDEGTNGISFYAPYFNLNDDQLELAESHVKISDNAVICNGDGEKAVVKEQHEFGSWEVTIQPQVGVAGEETRICKHGCGTEETRPIPALTASTPDNNETTIDDVDVPLAGLFTRADAIGYLWQQAGEPEAELSDFPDVDADHQWAVAIGWAQDMGIALPDLEGNFRPDDLVERFVEDEELKPEGELQEFLNRYAEYAGIELDEDELFYVLDGEADEIVMGEDAQVIFDDFFARLEAALTRAA